MTTVAVSQCQHLESGVTVLRRGVMSQREAAVCAYVWRCWASGGLAKTRGIATAAGLSHGQQITKYIARLTRDGWLRQIPGGERTHASRGPRMVGLEDGWPLEKVE